MTHSKLCNSWIQVCRRIIADQGINIFGETILVQHQLGLTSMLCLMLVKVFTSG